MIQYLKGKIEFLDNKFLVIEVGSVGYRVFCSPNTLKGVSAGQEVKIFTHLHVKEDALELFVKRRTKAKITIIPPNKNQTLLNFFFSGS